MSRLCSGDGDAKLSECARARVLGNLLVVSNTHHVAEKLNLTVHAAFLMKAPQRVIAFWVTWAHMNFANVLVLLTAVRSFINVSSWLASPLSPGDRDADGLSGITLAFVDVPAAVRQQAGPSRQGIPNEPRCGHKPPASSVNRPARSRPDRNVWPKCLAREECLVVMTALRNGKEARGDGFKHLAGAVWYVLSFSSSYACQGRRRRSCRKRMLPRMTPGVNRYRDGVDEDDRHPSSWRWPRLH